MDYVFLDHAGALDDFVCLLMLASYEHIVLRGTTVTPANCILEPAVSATRKVLSFANQEHVAVAGGTSEE